MSSFRCLNPNCNGSFKNNRSMWQHMRTKNDCANYVASTIMCSSDESDSETDSNFVSVNNFNIDIDVNDDVDDDDDDDNSNGTKRQKVGELFDENQKLDDRSFPISLENLINKMTPEHKLPPQIQFQLSLFSLLSSHPLHSIFILMLFN